MNSTREGVGRRGYAVITDDCEQSGVKRRQAEFAEQKLPATGTFGFRDVPRKIFNIQRTEVRNFASRSPTGY